MPTVDPALIARAEAQLNADPRVQKMRQSAGRAQGGGAIDPRQFGITYLPEGYVYSLQGGKVVNQKDYADWLIPTIAAVGGGLGVSGVIPGFGGLMGGAGAAPQLGNVNATIDALSGAQAAAPTIASTGAAAAAKGVTDKLTDPRSIAALASLGVGGAASLFGGVDGPMDDDAVSDEIAKSLALQRSRVEQAQPAYDALVRMAYGMTPTSYRGDTAPAGFQQPDTTNPAYQYQAPTFGGRR